VTRLLLSAGLLLITASAAADTFVLRGGVIASGGGTARSADDCYRLDDSFGEAVNGAAQGSEFELRTGYWASFGARGRDSVFHNGFQECL
jgi:hypothetical protein